METGNLTPGACLTRCDPQESLSCNSYDGEGCQPSSCAWRYMLWGGGSSCYVRADQREDVALTGPLDDWVAALEGERLSEFQS